MWFWFSLIALICWSGSDLFSKIGCQDADDKYSHLKMVMAVGVVMGLHAAYEIFINGTEISGSIVTSAQLGKLGLYVEEQLRRMVRDSKYRGTTPSQTLDRWPSVRRGEEKWIFPFQENADAVFNSSLIFELGVMKDYLEPLLLSVSPDDPHYAEARRLADFLGCFLSIPAEQVPANSLLREFLGGSSFHY